MYINALRKIDIFGFPIHLTYQTKTSHKTILGGFLTICIISLYIIAFYFFGKEIIVKTNPITIYNQEFVEQPAPFQIMPNQFPFAFGLEDGNTYAHYIDETIYQVNAKTYERYKSINPVTGESELTIKSHDILIGPCNVKEDLSDIPDTIEYFKRLDVSQMYCLKKNQVHIPEIEGQFDSSIYKSITFSFQGCKNTTSYNNCKPQEEIDKKLKAGFFSMNYVDLTINPRDPDHAYRYFGKDSYTYTSNLLTKNIDFFLKHVEMTSDEGWLFEENHQQHGIAFGEMRDMIDLRNNDVFCFLTIRLQSKKDVYSRSYKKVQNVMAEVQGFLKTMLIVCLFLSYPLTKLSFYVSLLNQLFFFTDNDDNMDESYNAGAGVDNYNNNNPSNINIDKNINDSKNIANSERKIEISSSHQIRSRQMSVKKKSQLQKQEDDERKKSALAMAIKMNLATHGQKKISRYQTEIQKIVQQTGDQSKKINNNIQNSKEQFTKSGGLQITLYEKIRLLLCPSKKMKGKMKKVKQTILKIKEHLDTVYILNKLQEVDKIKLLLLSPNQLCLFDLMSKPAINLDENDDIGGQNQVSSSNQISLLNKQKTHFQKIKEAYQAYVKIDQNKANQFDKKLIQMLDDNIRQIFAKAKDKQSPDIKKHVIIDEIGHLALNSKDQSDRLCSSNNNRIDENNMDDDQSVELPNVPTENEKKIVFNKFIKSDNIIK